MIPFRARRGVTFLFIKTVLWEKKMLKIDDQTAITLIKDLGSLAYWGFPKVDINSFSLTVDGAVDRPLSLSWPDLKALHLVNRQVRMDCVGGFRNNIEARGILLSELLADARPLEGARRAIFYCADGYFESSLLSDLEAAATMLVFETNGERVGRLGYPLRVAIPGKYGYKWAKWVQRVEIVTHDRKGYWPQRGLPDRANIGDSW